MNNKINNRINNIRFVAAIGVVIIHLNVAFTFGLSAEPFDTFFRYISRFAVPYFLIISGYFWMGRYKKEAIKSMLLFQLVLVSLSAIEEAIFSGIFVNYHQSGAPTWYLPAVSLMMLFALFIKEKDYVYLWFIMFLIANLIAIFKIPIESSKYEIFSRFLKYGYMFYFGYILKLAMNKPKFVNFISKYCYPLLAITIVFQIFNATNSIQNFSQDTTVQFLFTIPLVLYALAPNNDKAFKYNIYSLDLFLYHILFVSIFAFVNNTYFFIHVNDIPTLVLIFIIELLIIIPGVIYFSKFIRYLDRKYIQLIY